MNRERELVSLRVGGREFQRRNILIYYYVLLNYIIVI